MSKQLTKRERDQLVESLRCAADLIMLRENLALTITATLSYDNPLVDLIWAVEDAVCREGIFVVDDETEVARAFVLLEAAARVEAGEWPDDSVVAER